MLYAQPSFQALLRNMVFSFVRDPALHDELVQELIIHAWKTEAARPDQTPSWYRRSCYLHLLDLLGQGRSLDALKRRRWALALPDEIGEPESESIAPLPRSKEDTFSVVAAIDVIDELSSNLACRERAVLELVAQEFTVRDIATRLHLSLRAVGESRAQIRSVATQLGL